MMQEEMSRKVNAVTIRKFQEKDVPNKVKWINNPENNQYLHYDFPLNEENTKVWFSKIKDLTNRYDAIIEYEGVPVGIIGLLNIQNGKAEYYVTMGETDYKGKGIAKKATLLLLDYAFNELHLSEVYLYTEVNNISAQKLFEKCGFIQGKIFRNSAINRGKPVDRYYYSVTSPDRRKQS